MFIKRFLLVSCIASGLVLCIWWLGYEKVFYSLRTFKEIDGYEFDSDEEFKVENKDEISNGEIDNEQVIDEKNNLLVDKVKKNKDDVLFELVIPSIKLRKNVYTIDSSLNNVDKNVEILDNSNISKKLFYLASHSGSGDASYFDDLIYLEIGDIIWLYGDNSRLGFVVRDMFYINKNGYFEASYGSDGNVLFLITCSLEYVGKQLIVKADLVYGS